MIRAIYQWQVKLGYENVFVKAWVQGTKAIRAAAKGARDCVLLQSRKNSSMFMAVSWWDSFEDWWTFRQGEPLDHEAFRIASTVSDLYSVEAFYEVQHLRGSPAPEAGNGHGCTHFSLPRRWLHSLQKKRLVCAAASPRI
jgi:heme-degrading monooxygenase HmoA